MNPNILGEDSLQINFKDTGPGIPEDDISKLFEPFFTTKKKGKGVGLGLSVAYGIIQEHGGSIYVKSKAGQGTTFQVKLPLKSAVNQPKGLMKKEIQVSGWCQEMK